MSWIGDLITRRQPRPSWRRIALAGLGGAVTIAVVGLLSEWTGQPILAAAFGSTCVLLFTAPEAPFSQPINIVAGHLVSTLLGILVGLVLPASPWSMALAVGLAIATMAALRITHPPAGGDPIVVLMAGASWSYLLVPILVGVVAIVLIGLVFHRLSGTGYPTRTVRSASAATRP